ncbi:MAG: CpXC domain-containing protein [Bacteroidales bacterium]|nr:CpXC domain-containing protein [Bacteroidales bacterium]MBR5072214.1 CpXC domain-containing protein [Bacteroidales bacterium]
MTSQTEVSCSRCGARNSVMTYDSINVAEMPELKVRVLDGSLFVWECPHCGARNLVRNQTLYHDPSERLMVWLTGGSKELESKVSEAYGSLEEMNGYTARFVDDPGSLIEKVKVFDAGLDDVVMEMAKYVSRLEVAEGSKDRAADIMGATFRFLKLDGADNEITFAYPLDGRMQMVAVGFNVYEDCRGILKRNPDIAAAASGFARVDAAFVARFLR